MWNNSGERDPLTTDDISVENLLSPFSYGEETPLPPFQSGSAIHTQNCRGFISQDCQWGCSYSRNSIRCFPVDSFATNGLYFCKGNVPVTISTTSFHFQSSSITCATELALHNHKTVLGLRKVLLGLKVRENEDLLGALVIFDPIRCAPIKWISLPYPVSSVTVLSHYEEGVLTRPFFNEAMLTMVGVAAVGMQGGQVVIVDLGLDDPSLSTWDSVLAPGIHKYNVMPVDPHELLIAMKRHNFVTKKNLICIELTSEHEEESENENDYYFYCSPERTALCALEKDSISVTCLEYIPAIGSLIVGYSFGCFQIWSVDSATLIYSSPVPSAELANEVFGFAFQQPVDDPKNICYLWVLFGKSTLELHYSHAELFGLLYNKKPYNENFGHSYEEFRQCIKRLTIRMEDYFDSASENEDSTEEHHPLRRYSVRPIRIWSHSDHLTFFSWESSRNGVYYIGIFDLNQWYSNHASEKVRYSSIGLCPYWVAIPVETIDRFAIVWNVGVVPKSVEGWENPHSKLDLHLYPAAITFRGVCLSNKGTSTFEFFGIQEKLLRVLQKSGPDMMVDPGQFKNLCQTYGLEPVMSQCYDDLASQQDADRFFILSILLESRRASFILEMANKWLDGSYANVGCSVDLILTWISSFTCAIRSVADQHWENLLTFRNEVLPPETSHFINYSNFIWHALLGVLNMLMRPNEVYESHTDDLEDLKYALEKFVQYSAALLMFYKAGVLPEVDDHQFVPMMLKYYEQRRIDVKGALQNCDYLDPEIKSSHPLLIDYLLENFDEQVLREQWNLEPDENLYPPKHIGYILNMFMWAHEYPKAIARVIAYYLIDLSSIINETVKLRGDFASIIQLSTEEQTEIYNLWALDHGSCHEVLLFLSQKDRLHESDGLPWCAAVVLLTALGHGESIIELLQKSCPSKLGRLYFNLMTTSKTKYNFLIDDICSTSSLMETTNLQNFFEVSDNRNLLGEFVKIKSCSAPTTVTDSLVEYLHSHNNFENCDRLLSFYIHREDWDNLREVYNTIKSKSFTWTLTNHQKALWQVRQSLVESMLRPTRQDVQKYVSDGSPPIACVSGPSRKIKVHYLKRPYTLPTPLTKLRPTNNAPNDIKLPPQLRNIKLHETRSSCSLSPVRPNSGTLHVVFGGNSRNNTMNTETPKSARNSKLVPIRNISSSPDTPNANSLGHRKSFFRSSSRISFSGRSPINLVSLLKTPHVDHRVTKNSTILRDPDETMESNESIYGTPSGDRASTSTVHSIMKKQDSLRKVVCRKGLRFSEFAFDFSEGISNDNHNTENEDSNNVAMKIRHLDDPTSNSDVDCSFNEALCETISDTENEEVGVTAKKNEMELYSGLVQLPIVSDVLIKDNYTTDIPMEIETLNYHGEKSEPVQTNVSGLVFQETTRITTRRKITMESTTYHDRASELGHSYMSKALFEESSEKHVRTHESSFNEKAKPVQVQSNVTEAFFEKGDTSDIASSLDSETVVSDSHPTLNNALSETISDMESEEVELTTKKNSLELNFELEQSNVNEVLFEENYATDVPLEIQKLDEDEENSEPVQANVSKLVVQNSSSKVAVINDNDAMETPTQYDKSSDLGHSCVNEALLETTEKHAKSHECTLEAKLKPLRPTVTEAFFDNTSDAQMEVMSLSNQTDNSDLECLNQALYETKSDAENEEAEVTTRKNRLELNSELEQPNNLSEALLENNYTNEKSDDRKKYSEPKQANVSELLFQETISSSNIINDTMERSTRSDESSELVNSKMNEALLGETTDENVITPECSMVENSEPVQPIDTEVLSEKSNTPDAQVETTELSQVTERRVTRSQAKRSEFDVSGSEDSFAILEASSEGEVSPKPTRKPRGTRSGRSRSKTPSLLPVVKEDEELKIEPPVLVEVEVLKKEKTKKKKEKKTKEEVTPDKESPSDSTKSRSKRKSISVSMESSEKTPEKEKKRKNKKAVKENSSTETSDKPVKKRKRRQLQIYDYTPEFSTIVEEDSEQSSSVLQSTVVPTPPSVPMPSPPKARAKRTKKVTPKTMVPPPEVEKEKPSRRRRNDRESDDDSKSDISVGSSRSIRSTSTPELSILVDSDQSFSFLQATIMDPLDPRIQTPRRTRAQSRELSITPTKSISTDEVAERETPVKRRKRYEDSEDDAKSDISVASSRSTRSTASRKSTDRTLPKRTTRSSKK